MQHQQQQQQQQQQLVAVQGGGSTVAYAALPTTPASSVSMTPAQARYQQMLYHQAQMAQAQAQTQAMEEQRRNAAAQAVARAQTLAGMAPIQTAAPAQVAPALAPVQSGESNSAIPAPAPAAGSKKGKQAASGAAAGKKRASPKKKGAEGEPAPKRAKKPKAAAAAAAASATPGAVAPAPSPALAGAATESALVPSAPMTAHAESSSPYASVALEASAAAAVSSSAAANGVGMSGDASAAHAAAEYQQQAHMQWIMMYQQQQLAQQAQIAYQHQQQAQQQQQQAVHAQTHVQAQGQLVMPMPTPTPQQLAALEKARAEMAAKQEAKAVKKAAAAAVKAAKRAAAAAAAGGGLAPGMSHASLLPAPSTPSKPVAGKKLAKLAPGSGSQAAAVGEEEDPLPRAQFAHIVKRALPAGFPIERSATRGLMQSAVEFLRVVTSEANHIRRAEKAARSQMSIHATLMINGVKQPPTPYPVAELSTPAEQDGMKEEKEPQTDASAPSAAAAVAADGAAAAADSVDDAAAASGEAAAVPGESPRSRDMLHSLSSLSHMLPFLNRLWTEAPLPLDHSAATHPVNLSRDGRSDGCVLSGRHILAALVSLGFHDYAAVLGALMSSIVHTSSGVAEQRAEAARAQGRAMRASRGEPVQTEADIHFAGLIADQQATDSDEQRAFAAEQRARLMQALEVEDRAREESEAERGMADALHAWRTLAAKPLYPRHPLTQPNYKPQPCALGQHCIENLLSKPIVSRGGAAHSSLDKRPKKKPAAKDAPDADSTADPYARPRPTIGTKKRKAPEQPDGNANASAQPASQNAAAAGVSALDAIPDAPAADSTHALAHAASAHEAHSSHQPPWELHAAPSSALSTPPPAPSPIADDMGGIVAEMDSDGAADAADNSDMHMRDDAAPQPQPPVPEGMPPAAAPPAPLPPVVNS